MPPMDEDFRRAARALRFASDLAVQREDAEEKAIKRQPYLDGFVAYSGSVEVGGDWNKHYNNDNEANAKFKRLVDRSGRSLEDFIKEAIHAAKSNTDLLDFSESTRSGQLSTFRLSLWSLWGEDYKNMTIAAAVEPGRIYVFHSGPGS